MPDQESVVANAVSGLPSAVGSDLKVLLTCPACGSEGWIPWKDLSHGLQCPKCHCKFLLNRSGKLQSLAELPHVKYQCPRCKQSGSLPAVLAVRAAECMTCKQPLVCDSEQPQLAAREVRQTQQTGILETNKPVACRWWEKCFMSGEGRLHKRNVVLAGLLFLGVLWTGSRAIGRMFDNSPESRARALTYACLAGDQDHAMAYLPDDSLQRVEFDRWRMRYFPSILDKHRPERDRVSITVESISETPQTRIVRMTMASPFIGKRTCQQHWRNGGNQWQFDPVATLRAQDGTL